MKTVLALLTAAFIATPALAQRQIGWYVGPTTSVTQVNDEVGVMTGLKAGLILNHRLTLSIESHRLLNNVEANRPDDEGHRNTEFFFSGVSAAYAYPVTDRFFVEPRALVGGGEAHWREGFWDGVVGDWNRDAEHTTSLVLVPGADVRYALTPWLSTTLGVDYRFVMAGESRVLSQSDMSGPAASLMLRFGRF